jgi:hypothetical protein
MTPGNFNWFLHAMLFYHTKHVLKRAEQKKQRKEKGKNRAADDDDDDNDDNDGQN